MKTLSKLACALVILCAPLFSLSQATGYYLHVLEEHEGIVGDYDLTGYTTYELYVVLENEDDMLVTVTASGYSCNDPVSLFFDFPCGLFQHPDGGFSAWEVFCPSFEDASVYYDSYISMGGSCFGEGAPMVDIFTCSEVELDFENDPVNNSFDGGGIYSSVGFWGVFGTNYTYELPDGSGEFGCKIMQFTTCGSIEDVEFCFNALVMGEDAVQICSENIVFGCTDPIACNYVEEADMDDGSCEFTSCIECIGDANFDGEINILDLLLIIDNYGCVGNCPGDVDGNNVVNIQDIIAFSIYYSEGC